MTLVSSPDDYVRHNGTGRIFMAPVGSANPGRDIGEVLGLGINVATTKDQLYSKRTAARSVILTRTNQKTGTLSYSEIEVNEHALLEALMADAIASANQLAGSLEHVAVTLEPDSFVDVGKIDLFITKISHGDVSNGDFKVGESVTQADTLATGDIAWVGDGYIELINVSGTFVPNKAITGDDGIAPFSTAAVSGVEVMQDLVVTNANQAERYTLGTDYDLDLAPGYIRELSATSTIVDHAVDIAGQYPAKTIKTMNAMEAQDIQRKVTIITDEDDQGPRWRITIWKVDITLNGEAPIIGDGTFALAKNATILEDTSRPRGGRYFKVEVIE